jgi:N-acyl-D-amino-acid deacylase
MDPSRLHCDTLVRNVSILDGTGDEPRLGGVAIAGGRIAAVGDVSGYSSNDIVDGQSLCLAPGFIDTHTHDDLYLIRSPQMLPKLSQGVTTVITGNCGISGSPVTAKRKEPPVPANLLGTSEEFRYPTFRDYVDAVTAAQPSVNVASLVGHTTMRNNHMDQLDRTATTDEVSAMCEQLSEALTHGALGFSTGLAYRSAFSASEEEVRALAQPLSDHAAIYATHMRSEGAQVLDAIQEALRLGRRTNVPVVISHLKCTGIDNWHRSAEMLELLQDASGQQVVGWDCYPYAASSTTLDLKQVDDRISITITWSNSYPDLAGQPLSQIADTWGLSQQEAARRLQPAGAIYHGMSEDDVHAILRNAATMIGSDGLPNDRFPHPRLWGTFPRVIGRYSRELQLFSLAEAVRKMTSLAATRFGLHDRGFIKEGFAADLVLFDPATIHDEATFENPTRPATGIAAVWVNGILSYSDHGPTARRAGRFLPRQRLREPII